MIQFKLTIPLQQLNKLVTIVIIIFLFNDTATTEIYTLSLHDALPISTGRPFTRAELGGAPTLMFFGFTRCPEDRKSTRLNSNHLVISYAVFCLKKKRRQIAINGHITLNLPTPLQQLHVL